MTALEALNAKRELVKAQLARLSALVNAPQYSATNNAADWGHVGDMGHVEAKLAELVSFLKGEG